jgi:hypothetical protein
MTTLGYKNINSEYQVRDYLNDLRDKTTANWCFVIFVIDASNDEDGLFPDGLGAAVISSREYILAPVKITDNLDWRVAHETGHIFWAVDEYIDEAFYQGYLNVSSIPHSGGLMDTPGSWNLSGKPHGMNGTWGQVGWRDSDGDGIQDIVDTPNEVYLNQYRRIVNQFNFTGAATVTPYPNRNSHPYSSKRNVTINKIQSVQFRVDNGTWQNASMTPWKFRKLVRYPDTYEYKETYAVVNFTFLTPELSPGEHFIEIKATNQWGNEGYANATVTIPAFLPTDLNKDGTVNILDIAIVAKAFGSHGPDIPNPGDPPSKNWNATADMDKNGWINIIDIATVARDYGKTI